MSDAADSEKVPSVYQRLSEQFPVEAHKKVRKGGREQTYIPWTDKVARFNEVLGHDWSFRIVREGLTETEAWALGEITVTIDGVTTTRQQYGCEPIMRGQSAATDLFKIAGTDALSKAASLFGCGLYLSDQEERAEVEAAMQEAIRAAAQERRGNPTPRPAPASTGAANPGTQASRSATTPTASSAKPTSSSTATTPVETTDQRWQRLVGEAERANLPTLGTIKAIDPAACGETQMRHHCDRLEARLRGVQAGAA